MVRPKRQTRPEAMLPPAERLYAIGDIHGEAALFERLLRHILEDSRRRGAARTTILLIGDVIDRGADAAALLLLLSRLRNAQLVVLKGNHEAALVDSIRGDEDALTFWLQFGGRSTLAGFGIAEEEIAAPDAPALIATMASRIDPQLIDWLDALPTSWSTGDYFFVHAGIRPGVALERQDDEDLLWIREPFLSSTRDHGKVIVHGHTIEEGVPALGGNRIGLDTGGHEHGVLTAVGLEDGRQWIVQATTACRSPVDGTETAGPDRTAMLDRIDRLIATITAVDRAGRPLLLLPEPEETGTPPQRLAAAALRRTTAGSATPALGALALFAGLVAGAVLTLRDSGTGPAGAVSSPAESMTVMRIPAAEPVAAAPEEPPAPAPASVRAVRKARAVATAKAAGPRVPTRKEDPRRDPAADRDEEVADAVPAARKSDTATAAVHLTGKALETALEEDRVETRRLNDAELRRIVGKR